MKSLQKSIDILELFLDNEVEISLSDLSKLSGFNKSTVNRIASTLVKRGYLKQRDKRGKYSLGMKFLDFSGVIKNRIRVRDVAIPYLMNLSRLVNESVIMAIWDGREAVITETFHANQALKVVPDEGSTIPLHCTASGKIILANMADEELKRYYNNKSLERHTPNTITALNDLKKHIIVVKQEGIAFDDEEFAVGVRGVSAAIINAEGHVIGSAGVVGPSVRLTRDKMRESIPDVKSCALEISRGVGWKGESKSSLMNLG